MAARALIRCAKRRELCDGLKTHGGRDHARRWILRKNSRKDCRHLPGTAPNKDAVRLRKFREYFRRTAEVLLHLRKRKAPYVLFRERIGSRIALYG